MGMLYHENMAFGVGVIDCKGAKTPGSGDATHIFAGQGVTPFSTSAQGTAVANVGAIDIGKTTGVYKDQYYARIMCIEDFTGTALKAVTFKFWFLDKDTDTSANATGYVEMKVPFEKVNDAKRTPLEVSLPSCASRYCRLEISVDATAMTKGAVLVTVEPTSW